MAIGLKDRVYEFVVRMIEMEKGSGIVKEFDRVGMYYFPKYQ